jgi:hypothetical protein
MTMDRDNRRVFVGQTISPHRRLRQHVRFSTLKMRADAKSYKPFDQHFHMDVVYTTTRKYLADRMEETLIRKYQSEPLKSYNIMGMLKRKSTST